MFRFLGSTSLGSYLLSSSIVSLPLLTNISQSLSEITLPVMSRGRNGAQDNSHDQSQTSTDVPSGATKEVEGSRVSAPVD